MNIKAFKFLKPYISPYSPAILENESRIVHLDRAGYRTARLIAWCRNIHVLTMAQRVFDGSMEEFFLNRVGIPVIISINTFWVNDIGGLGGRIYYEGDKEFLSSHIFDTNPVRIYYYATI
jgi:hypothetical protein